MDKSGLWLAHISLPIEFEAHQIELIDQIITKIKDSDPESNATASSLPDKVTLCDEFHMSLSKPVLVKNSVGQSLTTALQTELIDTKKCTAQLGKVSMFESETATDSESKLKYFLAFEVVKSDEIIAVQEKANFALKSCKLSALYKNPIYHISFAYFLVDKSQLSLHLDKMKARLDYINQTLNFESIQGQVVFNRLKIKCGNKLSFCKFN